MQANASGFLRYVSLNGVTGVGQADNAVVDAALGAIREQSDLLICVGLGVRTPEQAAAFARTANGVVVGLALVEAMFNGGEAAALELTRGLAGGRCGAEPRDAATLASLGPKPHTQSQLTAE